MKTSNLKKKVGIITYHFAANYGAVLQCFALKKCIENFGCDASVINYISDRQKNNNSLYRKSKSIKGAIKNVILFPFHSLRKRRYSRFKNFVDVKILNNMTDRIGTMDSLQEFVDKEEYDYLISGSDQVWNPLILDFDKAFFYPFSTKAKKIGYAVSTGGANVKEVKPYKANIEDFEIITVRENTTANVVSAITDKILVEVCDPVFLLEKDDWLCEMQPTNETNYLLCYFVKTNEIDKKIETAEKIAKNRELKLIILSARISKYNFSKTVISNCGPADFLSYFAGADYICTDSFHGTSFSLILNKDFSTFERKAEKNDGRKTNLLMNVGACDRVHYLDEAWKDQGEMNYGSINKKIKALRSRSQEILISALDLIKEE